MPTCWLDGPAEGDEDVAGDDVNGRTARASVSRRQVLLLRHAWAGRRGDGAGDDRARPLDEHGRAQAAALVDHLPRALDRALDGATLVASPLVRCTATLQPLAEHLDRPVHTDPRLAEVDVPLASDDGWPTAAYYGARALAAVADAPRDGDPLVVCSHGEVLPALLAALAGDVALPVPATLDLTAKALPKGAGWWLDLTAGTVRTIDPPEVGDGPR